MFLRNLPHPTVVYAKIAKKYLLPVLYRMRVQSILRLTLSGPPQLSVLERCLSYREFSYSEMTEKKTERQGTNTRCLSYRIEVTLRELTVYRSCRSGLIPYRYM